MGRSRRSLIGRRSSSDRAQCSATSRLRLRAEIIRHYFDGPGGLADRLAWGELCDVGFYIEDGRAVDGVEFVDEDVQAVDAFDFAGGDADAIGAVFGALGEDADERMSRRGRVGGAMT